MTCAPGPAGVVSGLGHDTMLVSSRFRHVVFPRPGARRRPVVLAAPAVRERTSGDAGSVTEEEASFLRWLFERAGLDVGAYRSETLHRRLNACLRALRVTTTGEARLAIERSPALVDRAMSSLLLGVTAFVRDPDVFDWLVPEFAARPLPQRLSVWSAGCSDGAELYSVALALSQAGRLEGSLLLGTDCRFEAIQRARAGEYGDDAVKDVRRDLLARHFARAGRRWSVSEALRRPTRWSVANLMVDVPPGPWDVVLFRNTGMYFSHDALASLWPALERMLRPGGLLVVGRSERPFGTRRLVSVRPCVYRRMRG